MTPETASRRPAVAAGLSGYDATALRREARAMLARIADCKTLEAARRRLTSFLTEAQLRSAAQRSMLDADRHIRRRDSARALRGILSRRSDKIAGFSVAQALYDVARRRPRPDLEPGFYAELIHLARGVLGRAPVEELRSLPWRESLAGREAARRRSDQLDVIWRHLESQMARFAHGLQPAVVQRRARRRAALLADLGGTERDWGSWKWHIGHLIRDRAATERLIALPEDSLAAIDAAHRAHLPFAVTPFYLSLMDDPAADAALRAQVFPSRRFVEQMTARRGDRRRAFDFMQERDTSPIDLITRRYPSIAIFKPFNTCPQICVYCQRNWEIAEAMAPRALAPRRKTDAAIEWIRAHPAIREVLVTGGDPLALGDERLLAILGALADIPAVERLRLGTRMLVTLPMRFTDALVRGLGGLRRPGELDLAVVTHVEHAYELSPEFVAAVDRLKRQGISVYNQQVFTFYNSRRFESAALRRALRRAGVDPYYVFNTKGKAETSDFRVPIARLLQEQKEEARLLPGLERTDEAVYNLPRLGKNYLRAVQHRDLLTIRPDGARVYEFHPWEKNIVRRRSYVGEDVPILSYLQRLEAAGEDARDYASIWYYF